MLAALAVALAAAATPAAPASARPADVEHPVRPRIDVAFVLDATGSMGDEIDVVKARIVEIARKVASGQPRPDVRFGVVAYRDRGDAWLTRTFPFSRELGDVRRALASIDADGGGDEPEAVAEALSVAVHELAWDRSPQTTRMAFLIGDAGPQRYPDGKDWKVVAGEAKQAGIAVHAIGCSGLAPWADKVFAEIARRTGGELAHLTYREGTAVAADGRRRDVLRAGARTYVAERELSAEEWKKGAEALAASGLVKEVPASSLGAFGSLSAGSRAASAPSGPRAKAGLPGAPAAAGDEGNNLDAEIAGRIVEAAKAKGVAY